MSSTIDWSKAPEGATHYLHETDAWYASWFKRVDGVWLSMLEHNDDAWDVDRDMGNAEAHLVEKPVVWNGEGLPPVGTVCEFRWCRGSWKECTVFAHKPNANGYVDALVENGSDWWFSSKPDWFRPIRTPEQVAAEERKSAVNEMMDRHALYSHQDVPWIDLFEQMYDAGYRKVEQP